MEKKYCYHCGTPREITERMCDKCGSECYTDKPNSQTFKLRESEKPVYTVIGKATLKVSGEDVEVEIRVNDKGNLEFDGLGPNICYEMWNDELILSRC